MAGEAPDPDLERAHAEGGDERVLALEVAVGLGARVTISGNAPKNARAGKWITLMSDAFATQHTTNGIPSIRTQVLVNGKYSASATIRRGVKPTTYAVMGTFNGKALDTVAWIKVR